MHNIDRGGGVRKPHNAPDTKVNGTPSLGLIYNPNIERMQPFYELCERFKRAVRMVSYLSSDAKHVATTMLDECANRTLFETSGQLITLIGKERLATLCGQQVTGTVKTLLNNSVIEVFKMGGGAKNVTQYAFNKTWLDLTECELSLAGKLQQCLDRRLPQRGVPKRKIERSILVEDKDITEIPKRVARGRGNAVFEAALRQARKENLQ